jgi:N-acetylglucosaminyldiphosphoundecaprenol N-acetyl-beta-D-mannosaminyltransferase
MNVKILGMRVDVTSYPAAQEQIMNWARAGQSGYVCVANVHMTTEAYDQPDFRVMVNAANLVVPDGVPLVWMMRRMGFLQQERVYESGRRYEHS